MVITSGIAAARVNSPKIIAGENYFREDRHDHASLVFDFKRTWEAATFFRKGFSSMDTSPWLRGEKRMIRKSPGLVEDQRLRDHSTG